MSIAEQQIKASTGTLQIGRITYEFRRVTTADIVTAGGRFLLALRPRAVPGRPAPDEAAAKEAAISALQADPALLASGHQFQAAVACAGVVRASADDGATWETYRLVMDMKQESGPQNRAHVSVLGGPDLAKLAKAILGLTNKEDGTPESGESFPRGSTGRKSPRSGARRKGVP